MTVDSMEIEKFNVPSRGQAEEPGSPDAKSENFRYTKNQRSATAILRRRHKRRLFNTKCKAAYKSLRLTYSSPAEIKKQLKQLRKERRSCALVPHPVMETLDSTSVLKRSAMRGISNNIISYSTKPIFNLRSFTFIGSYNTRTLKANWRQAELTSYCFSHHIHILAIQEHRIYFPSSKDDDPVRKKSLGNGWWFIYSSASVSAVGGVGFILSKYAYTNLCGYIHINERILHLKFGSHSAFKTDIFSVYSPTSCSHIDDINSFYSSLSQSVSSVPLSSMLIVLGDFNATILPNTRANRNSEFLNSFIAESSLHCVNSSFTKSNHTTFYGPNNRKATLDYILIRDKWKSSVYDCSVKSPLNVTSDHDILLAKVKWTLSNNKATTSN
jgi:hypothetical protein